MERVIDRATVQLHSNSTVTKHKKLKCGVDKHTQGLANNALQEIFECDSSDMDRITIVLYHVKFMVCLCLSDPLLHTPLLKGQNLRCQSLIKQPIVSA